MSGHRVRDDMAFVNESAESNVDGGQLGARKTWGFTYLLRSAAGETRVLEPPSNPDQRLILTFIEDNGDIAVTVSSGTLDGTNDTATFEDEGDTIVLTSFYTAAGVLEWRITYDIGSVALS